MPKLALAMDIADMVSKVARQQRPLDVSALAGELLRAHPEAEATHAEILEVLVEETTAVAP